jgi:hypothetical protein
MNTTKGDDMAEQTEQQKLICGIIDKLEDCAGEAEVMKAAVGTIGLSKSEYYLLFGLSGIAGRLSRNIHDASILAGDL